jgi:hypothetical protein
MGRAHNWGLPVRLARMLHEVQGWPRRSSSTSSRSLRAALIMRVFIRCAGMLSPAQPASILAWLMSCATPILPSGPLGHVSGMPGHLAEIAGHDPEKAGHVRPKYARLHIEPL